MSTQDQVNQILATLGTDPEGVYANVRVRLDILEARVNNPGVPTPTVTNPFYIDGYGGVSISTGDGYPSESRVNGSMYLRRDGAVTEGLYLRRSGNWELVNEAGGVHNNLAGLQGGNSDGYYHMVGKYENIGGGTNTLASLTTGNYNVTLGPNTGYSLTDGYYNVLFGYNAGYNLNSGSYNTLVGTNAGVKLTNVSIYNAALGYNAFGSSGTVSQVRYCVAIGYDAMKNLTGSTNSSIAIGYESGIGVANSDECIAIGYNSATPGLGPYSIAIGSHSGGNNSLEAIAIGRYTRFAGNKAIAIGSYSQANELSSLVISGYGSSGSEVLSKGQYTAVLGYHSLYLGRDAGDSIVIYAHTDAANLPYLKYDYTDSKWKYSNDGLTDTDIGSGSGGGGGGTSIFKGLATDDTGVPTVIGACYIDTSTLPDPRTVTFRCVLESTSLGASYAAVADLYDTSGSLGAPGQVTGSQIDNTGVSNPQVASMVEVDISAAFAGTFTGVFEVRLWILTAGGANTATCKSAELIIV